MKNRFGTAAVIFAATLAASATPAIAAKSAVPPVPAPPLYEGYKADLERMISSAMKDPASTVFEYPRPPHKAVCDKRQYKTPAPIEIWVVNVRVNAKNSYGGYTGFQPYQVFVVTGVKPDGAIMQVFTEANRAMLSRIGVCRDAPPD